MKFYSTNDKNLRSNLKEAVLQGLAPDSGLYMPCELQELSQNFWTTAKDLPLVEIAFEVAKQILQKSIPNTVIQDITTQAINFETPLVEIHEKLFSLELFHGPTLAFKDIGARFMAQLMSYFVQDQSSTLKVLVATSGDTGGAVANGFYRTPGIDVIILYPMNKVSELQEKQLTTLGHNITAIEVDGSFDDCQRLVKQAFVDQDLKSKLLMSSANSINIARLIPQSFYYAYTAAQLYDRDQKLVISVPSGNFGNLTAGIMAQKLGAPIDKFIAATNVNDIVPNYLTTGEFKPKASIATISNAMDVGNPSNFSRLLDLFKGSYEQIHAAIAGFSCTDEETRQTIKEVYDQYQYILDPHGAVAYRSLAWYKNQKPEATQMVFLETAHPAKFIDVVEEVLGTSLALPSSLERLKSLKKVSTKMDSSFESLKEFLLTTDN